jgi:hypothetical protein
LETADKSLTDYLSGVTVDTVKLDSLGKSISDSAKKVADSIKTLAHKNAFLKIINPSIRNRILKQENKYSLLPSEA